jgi:hypothetical protein
MMNLLKKIPINKLASWPVAYGVVILAAATVVSIGVEQHRRAKSECSDKHGILITEKSGDYICIKEKSIIK